MLTHERAIEIFLYEKESGLLYRKLPNGMTRLQKCTDNKGYVITYADKKCYKAHRIIWLLEHGKFPDKILDHINGIRDDNRIENLREADFTQNNANKVMRKKKSNLPKGTRIKDRPKPYVAYIYIDKKPVYLGAFKTKDESAEAYNNAAIKHFGDYASLNKIGVWD